VFMVQGFRVLGFRVKGKGFRVSDIVFSVEALGFRVLGLEC
jgi:hypothetical protein